MGIDRYEKVGGRENGMARCKRLLKDVPDGVRLEERNFRFMLDVLALHPHADAKFGCGVASIRVETIPPYNTRGFVLKRKDGTETEFSYKVCFRAVSHSPQNKLIQACRLAVGPDMAEFKRLFFTNYETDGYVFCVLTGNRIAWEEAHVDHMCPATFDVIVREFLRCYPLNVEEPGLFTSGDGNIGAHFVGTAVEQAFLEHHRRLARLCVVSAVANTQILTQRRK